MKTCFVSFAALCSLFTAVNSTFAQGSEFTYQGRFTQSGTNFTGDVEFRFSLWNAASAGDPVTDTNTVIVAVNNGSFSVPLDFGVGAFPGADRWVQIEARTVIGPFSTLTPRQKVTATPYALTAGNVTGSVPAAQVKGLLPASQVSGTLSLTQLPASVVTNHATNLTLDGSFTGNGGGLTNVSASSLAGTVDDARLSANIARLDGGGPFTGVPAFNGGVSGSTPPFTVDSTSMVLNLNADLVDGLHASAFASSSHNHDAAYWKLGGNSGTTAGTSFLGTTDNQPLELKVKNTRALRIEPTTNGPNLIGGYAENYATTNATGVTIGGGGAAGQVNFLDVYDSSFPLFPPRTLVPNFGTIGGGAGNRIRSGSYGTIAGGATNSITGWSGFFDGGDNNSVGGGAGNSIKGALASIIAGGQDNEIRGGDYGVGYSTIGGGKGNSIWGGDEPTGGATIAGGYTNTIRDYATGSTIGGGQENLIYRYETHSTIAGGFGNVIAGFFRGSAIGGGSRNLIADAHGVIGGGQSNRVSNVYATIGGGYGNKAYAENSTIGGGVGNILYGAYGVVPGGRENFATNYCFATGRRAKALHEGSFVWADSQDAEFASTASNQVSFRCSGGVRFSSGGGGANQNVEWVPGGASWSFSSDRRLKEAVTEVDTKGVLEKVVGLTVSEWCYRGHGQRHIGPMAQDFHALFALNDNDTMLDSGDLHGVALAAIQGLNQRLVEELQQKQTEITELKQRLEKVEQLLNLNLNAGVK